MKTISLTIHLKNKVRSWLSFSYCVSDCPLTRTTQLNIVLLKHYS